MEKTLKGKIIMGIVETEVIRCMKALPNKADISVSIYDEDANEMQYFVKMGRQNKNISQKELNKLLSVGSAQMFAMESKKKKLGIRLRFKQEGQSIQATFSQEDGWREIRLRGNHGKFSENPLLFDCVFCYSDDRKQQPEVLVILKERTKPRNGIKSKMHEIVRVNLRRDLAKIVRILLLTAQTMTSEEVVERIYACN